MVVSFLANFIASMGQSALVIYLVALLHENTEIVRLTLLGVLGSL